MKPSEHLIAQPPIAKVATGGCCLGRLDEDLTKQIASPLHGGEERSFVARGTRRQGLAVGRGKRDPSLFGQELKCLAKLETLEPHYEVENVAADVANPALERLTLGVDLQAWPRVVVPGTIGHVDPSLPSQSEVTAG